MLDYINSTFIKENLIPESSKYIGNKRILERRRIVDNFVRKDIEISHKGKVNKYNETVKLYDYNSLEQHLIQLGYSLQKVFGNYSGQEFNEKESERLIIICSA